MFSFFLFSFSDVQKKWTFIVSYGGATEDMKLAICFINASLKVYLQYRSLCKQY